MTNLELVAKMKQAQDLLSDVYHYACETGMEELERVMSVADGCIIDGLDTIDE
jgi:hypothetical protein